jgi:hypothetical protein
VDEEDMFFCAKKQLNVRSNVNAIVGPRLLFVVVLVLLRSARAF